ncbi:MAG: IS30 family transposase [Candidatus Nanopelagicales bacterium]|nr:IS30 family transposase [Candidatus Nanopelagicales bacterium]
MIRPRSRRRCRAKSASNKGRIPGMTPISERPDGANNRTEFGHWEGDLIIGKAGRTAVATMVERVTRLTVIIKVSSRRSCTVIAALARRMRAHHLESITWDQGKELALHATLTSKLQVPVYFADAHSPWQRGSNENTNGVLRRHLPKGTSLDIHPAKLRAIQDRLNNRPMPVLSGATPKEAYAAKIANMQ